MESVEYLIPFRCDRFGLNGQARRSPNNTVDTVLTILSIDTT